MPWTRAQVCAYVGGASDTTLRRIEAQTEPIPVVPLPGRGASTIDLYDEAEVRAWWERRVADARAGRLQRNAPRPPAAPQRRSRPALRLPFAIAPAAPAQTGSTLPA